jgi:hypothetical protein
MDITYIFFYFKITDYMAFLIKIKAKMALILQSTQNTALSSVSKKWDKGTYTS